MVNHPPHYTSDPSGVECITITRHRNFNIGNAIKYLWRAGLKLPDVEMGQTAQAAIQSGMMSVSEVEASLKAAQIDKQIEDLKKAVFYINDEVARLEGEKEKAS